MEDVFLANLSLSRSRSGLKESMWASVFCFLARAGIHVVWSGSHVSK